MAVDPKKLIVAISPNPYCSERSLKEGESETPGEDKNLRGMIKRIVKENINIKNKDAYIKASEKAELVESDFMNFDEVMNPINLFGIKNPVETHLLEYETSSQALEQVYFWLHDYLQTNKGDYGTVEKLLDNFIAAPGSAHFAEMGARSTKMQEEGMKILNIANQLIKSILNIIYDLKEFKLRLALYDELENNADKYKSESAYLSLKQVWLDQVDIKRGNSSIKALAVSGANAPNFVMLIDAFMAAKSLEDVKNLDLNERVRRILLQRFAEFERWIEESERELRKRFEIEKIYLKSQLNSVKLYSRWAKPYLKAAAQLEQRASSASSLVTMFNTALFELILLGIGDYKPEADIAKGELPKVFKDSNKRKYAPVVLVELKFRSIPERFKEGYGFRGKAEITFTSFSLNEEERRILKEQLELDDLKDVYGLVEGASEESLAQLQTDLDEILDSPKKEEKKKESSEETNPFAALFSIITDLFKKSKKTEEKKEKSLEISSDSYIESVLRSQAGIEARRRCRKFYDSFKKANNSPAFL